MMQYIVMDLEWNNDKNSIKRGGFVLNEVIEIGAVRLDEQLCEIDAFSHLIKSRNWQAAARARPGADTFDQ